MCEDKEKELLFLLEQVPDPRCSRGVRYPFAALLLMCIYGVLAGNSEGTEIAYYVELNFDYFKEKLGIEHVPSHDTFSRVLRFTNFDSLSASLGEWLMKAFPEICEKNMGLKILHIDGKAVRGASEKSTGERPIYHLNAMYEGESIGVVMKRVGEKENEISCLPEFLKMFNLGETIVTMDAMGCNRTVIEAVLSGGGSYVLPVKENQKTLLKVIHEEMERLKGTKEYEKLDKTEVLQKNHGRQEVICERKIDNTAFIYEKLGTESFYGSIAKVGIMDKSVTMMKEGVEVKTKEQTIIITNLEEISAENLYKIKQAHWNIEMQHWLLDVQLNEDKSTARRDNAVTNGAMLRRFCMMVRKHDKELASKPMKRFLMANAHDIKRIERLLFGEMALNETEIV